ncbi:hypothetical protein PENANT_c001G03345 [Penicillium antarcticum]|uniref:RING-type domain-containing protein n=1 Tax=Penicillium antarcticum TaxID=416450 RepID=A0A1V6QNQ6_9EURO|nr:hypothetical protein PENANT_c001G03345 [Penicillium antarcticum]
MNLQEFLAMEDNFDRDELIDLRGLDFVSDYDSHLMCPICHCPFVDPVRLQCDHVFCQSCLSSAINTFRSADSDEFPCPSCRTPTREVSTSVPRLLINMCDEIRDIGLDGKCMHVLRQCPRCEEDVMEQDYEEHDKELCPVLETSCVDCETVVSRKALKEHVEACPEVIVPCAAAKHACPVKVRRADIAMHEQSCPLVTMIPYFEVQNTRLNSLELSMRHLQQRNEIFEDGLANIRSTLVESARIGASAAPSGQSANNGRDQPSTRTETNTDDPTDISSSVFSSNATTYLLSLHESLREEVEQIKHNLTDLDARASMALMNECIRMKEDMAHTNAAVNSVRMQVQWLMNPRLHGTRTGAVRANTGNETPRSPMASSSTAGSSSTTAQPLGPLRPRRPSDSGREGTKL